MFGWPHVLQDLHERMQTGRMHSNRASLPGLARWMQDEGGRLTRQSHRPERLHPLMQVTKQHLSFFLHPFMQPHQTLSFLNCVPSSRIYNAAPTRENKYTQREHHERGRDADLENNVWMVWLSSNCQHWSTENHLIFIHLWYSKSRLSPNSCTSVFLSIIIWINNQMPSGGARENSRGVCLPCGCVDFYFEGANMVKN